MNRKDAKAAKKIKERINRQARQEEQEENRIRTPPKIEDGQERMGDGKSRDAGTMNFRFRFYSVLDLVSLAALAVR